MMQTKPPFPLFPGNDSELYMPEAIFRALPQEAINILIAERAQKWEFYRPSTKEYFVAVYLPAAAAARLLAVCRPMLEGAS